MSTSGKYFRGRIGSTILSGLTRATNRPKVDKLDATDAESDGVAKYDAGVFDADLTLEGYHIVGASPWPTLQPGTIIANLRIWLQSPSGSTLTGPYWNYTSCIVIDAEDSVEVRGQIKFSVNVANRGAVTFNPG
jgi:hypothetical protein